MSQQPATSPSSSDPPAIDPMPEESVPNSSISQESASAEPKPSYVKLAMRNMVKKRGKSLYHFTLTTAALLAILVGLAYLTH